VSKDPRIQEKISYVTFENNTEFVVPNSLTEEKKKCSEE
jgi:hypothetical protein